jgi:hypothetical protein
VTTHSLRAHVILGALSAAALSLALVADAATTQAQRKEKQRRRPIPQEELDKVAPLWPAHHRAGLDLPLRLRQPAAAEKPVATVESSGVITNREPGITYPITRGAHRIGILPLYLPPFQPASPIH